MKQLRKRGPRVYKSLKEDLFNHLDSVYRSARRARNFAVALKAVELCLKAKQAEGKMQNLVFQLDNLNEIELEKMIQQLDNHDAPME